MNLCSKIRLNCATKNSKVTLLFFQEKKYAFGIVKKEPEKIAIKNKIIK